MSGNDRFVSPYLLQPLRTLEQVHCGRSGAVERGSERVEDRQARDRQDALRESADGEHRSVSRATTD
jgi:hypothetical protein